MRLECLLNIGELKDAAEADLLAVNRVLLNYFPKHMLKSEFMARARQARKYKLLSASIAAVSLPALGVAFILPNNPLRSFVSPIGTVSAIAAIGYPTYNAMEKTYASLGESLSPMSQGAAEARVNKIEHILNLDELVGASDTEVSETIQIAVRHARKEQLMPHVEELKEKHRALKKAVVGVTATGILILTYAAIITVPSLAIIDAIIAFAGAYVYRNHNKLANIYARILEQAKLPAPRPQTYF